MLGNLIGGFIVILVGVVLIPTVADEINAATVKPDGENATNVTGASKTLLELTTIFYAIGVMSAGVSLAVNGLKNAGLV